MGRFTFQEDRDGFDYLYTVDKLADLAGKKLHAKRNHIHRFDEQFPDWLFEPIGPDNLAECVEMEAKWYAEQVEAGRADANLGHERDAVNTALSHMEELGISGGLIRAGGQVVAFSLGSLTTADCYNVHFEKAYGRFRGPMRSSPGDGPVGAVHLSPGSIPQSGGRHGPGGLAEGQAVLLSRYSVEEVQRPGGMSRRKERPRRSFLLQVCLMQK